MFRTRVRSSLESSRRRQQGDEVTREYRGWDRGLRRPLLCTAVLLALLAPGARAGDSDAESGEPAVPQAQDGDAQSLPVIALEPPPAEAPPGATSEDRSSVQLEEIVVTATKRARALRQIPASIASLSGEDLERSGAQGAADFVKLVPGVNLTFDGVNAAQVTIRGIAAIAGTNPTTGILFGDVAFTDFYVPRVTLDPNPFDLQSVEVLKGPQGTLFGAGALNGAVRYLPEPAVPGLMQGKYFIQYTDLAQGDAAPVFGAAVNLPIGVHDRMALRLTGFRRREAGYVDDLGQQRADVNRLQQDGIRGIFAWQPGGAGEAQLSYAWQQTDTPDSAQADNLDGRLSRANTRRASPSRNAYRLADLKLGYDFGGSRLVSDTAFVRKQSDVDLDISRTFRGNAVPVARVETSHSDTWSQELRIASADDTAAWTWIAGVFALKQDIGFTLDVPVGEASLPAAALIEAVDLLIPGAGGLVTAGGQPNVLSLFADVAVQEQALFGEATLRFAEDWEAALGARLYRTRSGGTVVQSGLLLATNGGTQSVENTQIRQQGLSPRVSLSWQASDQALAYAAVSRGFRVGGVQIGATTLASQTRAPRVFRSDSIWNYELGLRTDWLDKRLRLDLTGFYSQWKDPQTIVPDASGLIVYYDNVGGVRTRGAEAALRALLPIDGLSLSVAAAFTDTVTTAPFTAPDGTVLPPGHRWPLAPRWQTASSLDYRMSAGSWLLGAGLTHTYLGTAISNLAQRAECYGYSLVDLQISAGKVSLSWLPELSLVLGNLGDTRGRANVLLNGSTSDGAPDVTYTRPRSLSLRLTGRF